MENRCGGNDDENEKKEDKMKTNGRKRKAKAKALERFIIKMELNWNF